MDGTLKEKATAFLEGSAAQRLPSPTRHEEAVAREQFLEVVRVAAEVGTAARRRWLEASA